MSNGVATLNTVSVAAKGGAAASVSGMTFSDLTTLATIGVLQTIVAQINASIWYSGFPEQIVGLVPLNPCSPTDCRDTTQISGFRLPVFGVSGASGPSYENDENTFLVNWPGQACTWVIQQLQDDFFKRVSSNTGQWLDVATISDNTYGTFLAQGSIVNYPNRTQFTVNWGKVVNAFGNGIYRISLGVSTNQLSAGTQAALNVPISSFSGSQQFIGVVTIGAVSLNINFNGTYQGYLNYLVGLINSNGTYTAVIYGSPTGIQISGKTYAVANGTKVTFTMTDTTNCFKAYGDLGLPPAGLQPTGDYTQLSLSAAGRSGVATATTELNTFKTIAYNNGSCWDGRTYTNGNDPIQIFSGALQILPEINLAQWAGQGLKCTIELVKNGNTIASYVVPLANPPAGMSYPFTFPQTDGIAGRPQPLVNGDTINLNTRINAQIFANTSNTGTATIYTGGSFPVYVGGPPCYFMNTPVKTITSVKGILSGGINPTFGYECVVASPPFELWQWDCNKARSTVKFESTFAGTIGDRFGNGSLFNNSGNPVYDSVRLPGFFGKWEGKYTEVVQEYGFNPNVKMGTIVKVRDKQVGGYKLSTLPVPYELIRRLSVYGFMPSGLLISDYNFNNADWFVTQFPAKKSGSVQPKYMNEGNFPLNENWKNRLCYLENMEFEEGIQSIIYSYADLLN